MPRYLVCSAVLNLLGGCTVVEAVVRFWILESGLSGLRVGLVIAIITGDRPDDDKIDSFHISKPLAMRRLRCQMTMRDTAQIGQNLKSSRLKNRA